MTEDVTELVLNVKGIVVSTELDEPVTMYLRASGPGAVTAGDIEVPGGVEVHNPALHLASLGEGASLSMEFTVERGRGYVPAAAGSMVEKQAGRILVDAIYSPVLKVTYKVEATRVEQRTDFDRLIVDVETKPSIRARDAVASAGKTLVELFGLARDLNAAAEGLELGPSEVDTYMAEQFSQPIEALNLSVRSYNCLKREGVHTIGELLTRSEADLMDIRNFGQKSIDEVKDALGGLGLNLKDSPAGFDPSQAVTFYAEDDQQYAEDEQL
jgi:DNA-directed RNA polymerase subunit alpha